VTGRRKCRGRPAHHLDDAFEVRSFDPVRCHASGASPACLRLDLLGAGSPRRLRGNPTSLAAACDRSIAGVRPVDSTALNRPLGQILWVDRRDGLSARGLELAQELLADVRSNASLHPFAMVLA